MPRRPEPPELTAARDTPAPDTNSNNTHPATAATITGWPVSRIRTTLKDSRHRAAPTVGNSTNGSHQSDAT